MAEENTHLADLISSIENDRLVNDACAKEALADKEILSRILKGTMKEFSNTELSDVKNCIAPEIDISKVKVNPGLSNIEKVRQENVEDNVNAEGVIYYDLRTHVRLPESDIKILINVEAQKSSNPGYDIETRANWYAARMLSSQLNVEFTNRADDPKKYANIKKVYSIWIVINPPQYLAGTIKTYSLQPKTVFEEKIDRGKWQHNPYYDIMETVIVFLSPLDKVPVKDSENELVGMLTTLFQIEGIDNKRKMKKLQEKYNVSMTNKLEKAVNQMCNYSEAVEEVKEAKVTARVTARITAEVTARVTAKVTDEVTAKVTDEVTAKVTDEVTARVTDEVTAKVTDEVTAKVTDEVTAKVTDEVTNKMNNDTVVGMLKEGLSLDVISRVTNLTFEQVTSIGKKAMLL